MKKYSNHIFFEYIDLTSVVNTTNDWNIHLIYNKGKHKKRMYLQGYELTLSVSKAKPELNLWVFSKKLNYKELIPILDVKNDINLDSYLLDRGIIRLSCDSMTSSVGKVKCFSDEDRIIKKQSFMNDMLECDYSLAEYAYIPHLCSKKMDFIIKDLRERSNAYYISMDTVNSNCILTINEINYVELVGLYFVQALSIAGLGRVDKISIESNDCDYMPLERMVWHAYQIMEILDSHDEQSVFTALLVYCTRKSIKLTIEIQGNGVVDVMFFAFRTDLKI